MVASGLIGFSFRPGLYVALAAGPGPSQRRADPRVPRSARRRTLRTRRARKSEAAEYNSIKFVSNSNTGRIGWIDRTVEDATSLKNFYQRVIGWGAEPVEMDGYSDFCP